MISLYEFVDECRAQGMTAEEAESEYFRAAAEERERRIEEYENSPETWECWAQIEKVIIDHLYIGDQKVTDMIASGRLRLVGFCKECKHCFPPLLSKVDGEVVQVTTERCSIWNGYVEQSGWCYKFKGRS